MNVKGEYEILLNEHKNVLMITCKFNDLIEKGKQ